MAENKTKKIFSKTGEEGVIIRASVRYCAACQCIHPCYIVRWPNGKTTKPCSAGCRINARGHLEII